MRTKILVGASFLALGVAVALLIYFYEGVRGAISSVIVTPHPAAQVTPFPLATPDPNAPIGVLLLGLRGDTSRGGFLTDTMILAYAEPAKKHITLISIPRDLWVPLPINSENPHFKINHAYAIGIDDRNYPDKAPIYKGSAGGGTLAKKVVSDVTGLPIQYFVSLDFIGFEKAIDILGGIDVNVTRSFEDPFFPITGKETDPCGKTEEEIATLSKTLSGYLLEQQFPCRYEHLVFTSGNTHMDGITALKFARSRHSATDGSDFARSERQKQVILGVKNKVIAFGFLPKAIPFLQTFSQNLRTDINANVIQSYLGRVEEFRNYTVSSIAITTENALEESYSLDRQYILVPKSGPDNWNSIKEFIKSELSLTKNGGSATPSPSPRP